jgi:low temperature requirement protein LtrA
MPESKTPEPKTVRTAVIISFVGGILIVLGSFYANSLYATFEGVGMPIGIITGILVLLAAITLKIRPGESTQGLRTCCLVWGGLILVLSVISLIAGSMIGLIGSILGIIGAALAMTTKV